MNPNYNGTMNTIANLGKGIVGIPTREGEFLIPAAIYNTMLTAVTTEYPDAPNIEGMVLGQDISKAIAIDPNAVANNNPPRFFVWLDRYKNSLMQGGIKGRVAASYRTPNQVYAVLLDAAGTTAPVVGQPAMVDTAKYMFTTVAGKTAIPRFFWASYDDGLTVKVDSFGRKIALVEVV